MYLESLEVVASLPIPEVHCPIICSRNHHSVGIGSKTIDNGVVSGQVLDELSVGTFPLLDVVRAAAGEHEQLGVENQTTDRLLMVGQSSDTLTSSQIPQTNGGVIAGCQHL